MGKNRQKQVTAGQQEKWASRQERRSLVLQKVEERAKAIGIAALQMLQQGW